MAVFKIDNKSYNVTVPEEGISRKFSVLDTDKAGRGTDGNMIRDIIGTYYNYTLKIETSKLNLAEYDSLYETISAPVDYHVIEVPYAQTTLVFKAYISNGTDGLRTMKNGNLWQGLTLDFVAMSPQRR